MYYVYVGGQSPHRDYMDDAIQNVEHMKDQYPDTPSLPALHFKVSMVMLPKVTLKHHIESQCTSIHTYMADGVIIRIHDYAEVRYCYSLNTRIHAVNRNAYMFTCVRARLPAYLRV